MRAKEIITIFCLLVLSFQLLPVRQLGSLLFSSQLTEELPHAESNVEKDIKGKLPFKNDFLFCDGYTSINLIQIAVGQYIHFATALPSFHTKDIHTPPPNLV